MLTETFLRIPFSVTGRKISADLSLTAGKMHKNELGTGGFRYDFTESQAASCKHFQSQNHRFRVFEGGYWKDFQN
jgi:hypothetical protein